MNPTLGREWLLANLPHQGAMNLLDAVERWDAATIHASATRHREPGHPLRRGGMLPSSAGIEYAAQAAAAHGALASGAPSPGGLIASLRGVAFHSARLDHAQALAVFAEQLGATDAGVLYRFEVSGDGLRLVEGRLAVAFVRP